MAPTDPKTYFEDVHGTRIAYWDAGAGRPVVFVHGNFASKRWFRAQLADRLATQRDDPLAGWRFVAPDLPSFGESGPLGAMAAPSAATRGTEAMPGTEATPSTKTAPSAEVTLERYAAALAGLVDALRLERVVLVGHSLGGGVAQTFAVERPERVAGMFLISSPPPSGFTSPPGTEEAQRGLRDSAENMSAALAATMPTHRPNDYDQIVSDALALPIEVYGPHNRMLAAMDLTAKTGRVTSPVLVLRGEHDHLISEAMACELAEAYPNARLELWDDVGHSPQVEAPSRFRALLAEFLEGVAMT